MKFYQEYALIAYLVIRAVSQVQGRNIEPVLKNKDRVAAAAQGYLAYLASGSSPAYGKPQQQTLKEHVLKMPYNSKGSKLPPKTSKQRQKLDTRKMLVRKVKLYESETSIIAKQSDPATNTRENLILNLPPQVSFRAQKIYCRQIVKTESNEENEIIESIQHICTELPTSTNTTNNIKPSPASLISINRPVSVTPHLRNIVSSTPRGNNCRRVMNSELNDLGEIVDSVTEVCDPPSTTTTTTPMPTTTKVTTTTAKPLIKICWPVMDSHLNEEGKIVDFVNIFCKMEPAK